MITAPAPPRYVSRPVTIEAVEWTGRLSDIPAQWLELDMFDVDGDVLYVRTLEGLSTARIGDFVIRGTAGEFYPVRRPIFREKYQEATT